VDGNVLMCPTGSIGIWVGFEDVDRVFLDWKRTGEHICRPGASGSYLVINE
jgi:hypothetical protein